MAGKTAFDDIAQSYDVLFTRSLTGVAQRNIVRRFLKSRIAPGMEIFEVNCGTGEDALFMADSGCSVTATDASEEMIRQCLSKSTAAGGKNNPVFITAGISEVVPVSGGKKYDLIFSNFSGLNCIDESELTEAARHFNEILKPGGHLIFILFGTNCTWEKFYFFLKGKRKEMNRRKSRGPVHVKLMDSGIDVFYYSPKEISRLFKNYFDAVTTRPVGFFLPPTYLEHFFNRKKRLFRLLAFADRMTGSLSFLSNRADHYIIEMKKP